MKAPLPRHERSGSHSKVCVVFLLGILVSAMSLGSLRLYGIYLEHRLTDVTKRIETVSNNNSGMEEQYSALLSPSRIYNYARLELNMTIAKEIETITIRGDASEGARLASAGEAESVARSPGGLFGIFVGRANAKD